MDASKFLCAIAHVGDALDVTFFGQDSDGRQSTVIRSMTVEEVISLAVQLIRSSSAPGRQPATVIDLDVPDDVAQPTLSADDLGVAIIRFLRADSIRLLADLKFERADQLIQDSLKLVDCLELTSGLNTSKVYDRCRERKANDQ